MDQRRVGAFIARLRQEKGWTQEELGGRLGVTNKTVSRWETGSYMPGIEALSLMGKEFGVSLNELVEGRRLEGDEDFRAAADQNLATAMERPLARFWRWFSHNYVAIFIAISLLLVLAIVGIESIRYHREHPVDGGAAGTWVSDPGGFHEEYVVLLGGEYYRYRQFEALEYGTWQADGALVSVTTAERSFDALIKGDCLYVPDQEGRLTAYRRSSYIGVFVNIHSEDFKS